MHRQICVITLALLCGSALGQNQRVVLYDQYNQNGNYIIIPDTYVSDLSTLNFDNKAASVCATGVWILYEDYNYNPTGSRKVEYIFGSNNFCVNLLTLNSRASSLRFAGHPKDYQIDSFTIYEHIWFQGNEEYTYNEIATLGLLNKNNQSVIITGSSDWTVYELPRFLGKSACLRLPANGNPAFIDDLQKSASSSIPHGRIQSVRKGCTSSQTIEMKSFE